MRYFTSFSAQPISGGRFFFFLALTWPHSVPLFSPHKSLGSGSLNWLGGCRAGYQPLLPSRGILEPCHKNVAYRPAAAATPGCLLGKRRLRPHLHLPIQNLNQPPGHWSWGHCGTERGRGRRWVNWQRWKKKEKRIIEGCRVQNSEVWRKAKGLWTNQVVESLAQSLLTVTASWRWALRTAGVNYGHKVLRDKVLRGLAINPPLHPCEPCPSLEAGNVHRRCPVPWSLLEAGGCGLGVMWV